MNIKSYADDLDPSPRHILLIEPDYKNKYPPLGLMKLSSYHKKIGDIVYFLKGNYSRFILNEKYAKCINKLKLQRIEINNWEIIESLLYEYLKKRNMDHLVQILDLIPFKYYHTFDYLIGYYAFKYRPEKRFDRAYITTLFTFHLSKLKEAVEFARLVSKSEDSVFIGGIAASLIPEIVLEETKLKPASNIKVGLLDRPGILDNNELIIDEMEPDYNILDTVEYKYSKDSGFLAHATRGCTRKCGFCAVPKLEPQYKERIPLKEQIESIRNSYGDRKDLILMDNNILGSPVFNKIVKEILDIGFTKHSTFVENNKFLRYINQLSITRDSYNEAKYIDLVFEYLKHFGAERIRNLRIRDEYYQVLHDLRLDNKDTFSRNKVVLHFNEINLFVDKYRNKAPKKRYIDFNQGLDCRYINEEKMKLISELPINPMRIAFDDIALKDKYIRSIELADKYGIKELSNYILFNHNDRPVHLWERLYINVELNERLKSNIFSFPMKFVPVFGKDSLNRNYIGKFWNPKYLRAIQSILNVKRGIGMTGRSFFEKAFGKNPDEYFEILTMPESYIIYRFHFEGIGQKEKWQYEYRNLNRKELEITLGIVFSNDFSEIDKIDNRVVRDFLRHYQTKNKSQARARVADSSKTDFFA